MRGSMRRADHRDPVSAHAVRQSPVARHAWRIQGRIVESTTTISLIGARDQSKRPRIINHSVVSETGTVTNHARRVADMHAMA